MSKATEEQREEEEDVLESPPIGLWGCKRWQQHVQQPYSHSHRTVIFWHCISCQPVVSSLLLHLLWRWNTLTSSRHPYRKRTLTNCSQGQHWKTVCVTNKQLTSCLVLTNDSCCTAQHCSMKLTRDWLKLRPLQAAIVTLTRTFREYLATKQWKNQKK